MLPSIRNFTVIFCLPPFVFLLGNEKDHRNTNRDGLFLENFGWLLTLCRSSPIAANDEAGGYFSVGRDTVPGAIDFQGK